MTELERSAVRVAAPLPAAGRVRNSRRSCRASRRSGTLERGPGSVARILRRGSAFRRPAGRRARFRRSTVRRSVGSEVPLLDLGAVGWRNRSSIGMHADRATSRPASGYDRPVVIRWNLPPADAAAACSRWAPPALPPAPPTPGAGRLGSPPARPRPWPGFFRWWPPPASAAPASRRLDGVEPLGPAGQLRRQASPFDPLDILPAVDPQERLSRLGVAPGPGGARTVAVAAAADLAPTFEGRGRVSSSRIIRSTAAHAAPSSSGRAHGPPPPRPDPAGARRTRRGW